MLSREDMAVLTAAEEKRLGVNSPKFMERHNEIMKMADEMDFEKAFNFMYEIAMEDKERISKAEPIEKITYLVHRAYMGGFTKAFVLYNDAVRDTLNGIQVMGIDDIKIYPCFVAHEPKPEKMQQKEQYFVETGALQSQIIIDSRGNLIDGYTSYLIAKAQGMESVFVKYGRRQIIRAGHRSGGKLYAWELPGLLIDRVHIGDKVIVRTERGFTAVTVAAVEEYAGQEPEPLKMVIRVKQTSRI